MAKGPSYRVPFRRRREGKTDYQSRRALVLSKLPRLVARRTLRHIIVQIVKAEDAGDHVVVSAHSSELTKTYGWKGGCGNVPAAYLTGLLCGFRAVAHGVKKAVLDLGLQSPSRGARVFAALKGVLDAGVMVPHSESMLPDENRISGQHVVDYASQLSSNPEEAYKKKFSKHLSRGLRPEQLSEHFSLIKKKIISSFRKEEEGK
ncbi:MAG: 50S ribosomal protein L18P [Candidatus Bathyarchaeota archaeon BA2]|nr:MAG: 50S ribosomal protein L18P [Candidatus Bathyarchaeota archaeon BA2]